jgi:hypothetical protein
MYRRLPPHIRLAARGAHDLFAADPSHPSLNFKPLQGYPNYYSARVTLSYRVVCKRDGQVVIWFWIGSHAEFDRDFG